MLHTLGTSSGAPFLMATLILRKRRKATADGAPVPIEVAEPEALPPREARRRWAELLRRIYEVDPLTCPACGGAMRYGTRRGDGSRAGARRFG